MEVVELEAVQEEDGPKPRERGREARETQISERANSRELPRGRRATRWTELCQGKKKNKTKNQKTTKNCPLSCSPQTQTPGRKNPAAASEGRVHGGTEGPPPGHQGDQNTLKVQQCKAEGFPFCLVCQSD